MAAARGFGMRGGGAGAPGRSTGNGPDSSGGGGGGGGGGAAAHRLTDERKYVAMQVYVPQGQTLKVEIQGSKAVAGGAGHIVEMTAGGNNDQVYTFGGRGAPAEAPIVVDDASVASTWVPVRNDAAAGDDHAEQWHDAAGLATTPAPTRRSGRRRRGRLSLRLLSLSSPC